MKKHQKNGIRILSLLLLLALALSFVFSLTACEKPEEETPDTPSDSDTPVKPSDPDQPIPKTGEFTLNVYAVTIEEGASAMVVPSVDPASLTWATSDPAIATVSGGVITGVKAGVAEITASNDVDRALCRVTVTEKENAVPALSLSASALSLFIGATYDLAPVFALSGAPIPAGDYEISFRSANASVATIENGVVTAQGKGSTVLTVSVVYGSYYYEKTAAVTVSDIENYLLLSSGRIALCYGNTVAGNENTDRVSVPLDPAVYRDGVRQNGAEGVSFRSSDENIVTVDAEGVLTARGIGRATVTAEYIGDLYEVTVTVGTPIASADDLNALADAYRSAEDKIVCPALWRADQIFVLAHDIDFHGASFSAIASVFRAQDGDIYWYRSSYQTLNASTPYAFAGTIDGAGHAIKNMTIAPVMAQWSMYWFKGANFIGYLTGTLRDIAFTNLTIGESVSQAIQDVGLIHDLGPGATLDNVYVEATVKAGQFAGNGAVLAGNWSYDSGNGNSVVVKNCVVKAEYADGWEPVDTYGQVSKRLGAFICYPNGNKTANISSCYLISSTFTENELYGCAPYFDGFYADADAFSAAKQRNVLHNEGYEEFLIDYFHEATGYLVRHYLPVSGTATEADLLYVEEFVKGEPGMLTAARARTITGFIAPATIEQQIIGENTVVNIFYTRDMLIDTFEQLPLDGNYSFQAQGYEDSGKILLLAGEATPYSMGYRSIGIWVTTASHSGSTALEFKKDGYDTHTMICITLTAEQTAALQAGGGLSFWYKSAGLAYFRIGGVDIGEGANDWTKVVLTEEMLESAKEGMLTIQLYNTWYEGEFYIDDIVVTPAA